MALWDCHAGACVCKKATFRARREDQKKKKKESKQETASNSMEEKLEKDKQKKSEMTKWRKRKKLCFAIEKTNADKRAGLRGL